MPHRVIDRNHRLIPGTTGRCLDLRSRGIFEWVVVVETGASQSDGHIQTGARDRRKPGFDVAEGGREWPGQ